MPPSLFLPFFSAPPAPPGAAVNPQHVIFVMDGSIGQAAFDQAKAFHESVDVSCEVVWCVFVWM